MSLHPYLFFTNNAREAMTRYQEIFGGQLDVMSFADLPAGEEGPPGVSGDLVMNAALRFDDGDFFMASDDPTGDGAGVKGVAIAIQISDQDEARRIFTALTERGTVQMPLGQTFWSPLFGSGVDEFGVSWMVSVLGEDQS